MAKNTRISSLGFILSFPSAEIGMANGSEEDFDSNLHFLGRVDPDLFDDQRLARTPSDGSFADDDFSGGVAGAAVERRNNLHLFFLFF